MLSKWTLATLLLLICQACADHRPAHVAVLMPTLPPGMTRQGLQWATELVNATGGPAGHPLILDTVDYPPGATDQSELKAAAARLAADDQYVAVIGPGASADLAAIADLFLARSKPLVSFTSGAAETLRAYGGKGFLWRTRQSGIAQTELLLRMAASQGAKKLTLLTTLDPDGDTFFSWFGFFAKELGYAEDAIHIEVIADQATCRTSTAAALAFDADMVFVASGDPGLLQCALAGAPPIPGQRRVVVADTGLYVPLTLMMLGQVADGVEGISQVAMTPDFDRAFQARTGQSVTPQAASEYDAVLLLAYGLAVSQGRGGQDLIDGMKAAVDGTQGSYGWDAQGVQAALAALASGQQPDVAGATGPLQFVPNLYMDLAASEFTHWDWHGSVQQDRERFWTGDPQYVAGQRPLVTPAPAGRADLSGSGGGYVPAAKKSELWAVIAALSSGWDNYRHQADALRQYQLLRANGVPDDHIILVLADDIASASQNALPGTVRNQVGGDNLYHDLQIDYRLNLSADDLTNIITGQVTATTPQVIRTTAASDLYIYLVGHGGRGGLTINATTAAAGLGGGSRSLSPGALSQALCTLRSADSLRRALVVIESCYGGVFGDASYSGLAAGCNGGTTPLSGVTLLSAANTDEVSLAAGYDPALGVWLGDEASQQLAGVISKSRNIPFIDLYSTLYTAVAGSHVSIYNTAAAGSLVSLTAGEFFTP